MKTQDKNPLEQEQKRHYKKRYLLRKLEEQEAEQEIKKYEDQQPASDPPRQDGDGSFRS